MAFVSTPVLAVLLALLAPSAAAALPTPTFEVDFADPDSVDANVKEITADVRPGPDGVSALRIDACGKHAILPVDVTPTVMPEATLVLGIRLVSVPEDSLGWPLSSDNGGYDRSIVVHDFRFLGMGMPSGYAETVWESPEQGQVPLNEWKHLVAVYSQPLDATVASRGVFYVDGVAAPLQIELFNGDGTGELAVGTNMLNECTHWTDSWIKEVKVFDSALAPSDVEALYQGFLDSLDDDDDDDDDDDEESSSDDSDDEPGLLDGLLDSISNSISGATSSAPAFAPSNTGVVARGLLLAVALLAGLVGLE